MAIQIHEKVHVVLGNEVREEEGFLTLNWVIKKWGSHNCPFSIVIFFINSSSSKEFVSTFFGKLPVSAVSEEQLQIMKKNEQDKIDSLLSKYLAFCGKFPQVKTETRRIEKHDEPMQKIVLELIMQHRITKLVMGMTLTRSSSGRSKSAISESFYLHANKPEFCELYFVAGGKLMILKGENEEAGHLEDEQGVILLSKSKNKSNLKDWLGKMLSSSYGKSPVCPLSPIASVDSNPVSKDNWEKYEQEIEEYFKELSMEEEENNGAKGFSLNSPIEPDVPDSVKNDDDRVDTAKKKLQVVQNTMEVNKNKVKDEVDRQAKASWIISLCNRRVEELEALAAQETATCSELTKELANTEEQLQEILRDVEESKTKLSSLHEIESELRVKLQAASLSKLGAEARLDKAVGSRSELVMEIEELRKQRDVVQRRIEFCKEKDAIGMAIRMDSNDKMRCGYREFSADEIRLATDNFSSNRRLRSGGEWTNVYKGKIKDLCVAIKVFDMEDDVSQEVVFQDKVNFLGNVRHPHITAFIGFCSELRCMVFEFTHNGCLRDILFSRRKGRLIQWHHRIHVAAQVGSGLGFLHLAEPKPIVHGWLNPSSIFLDQNFMAKINALELTHGVDQADLQANVGAFGNLLLQILTGRNWARLDQQSSTLNKQAILDALDDNAGDWPLDLAEEFARVALKCRSICSEEPNVRGVMSSVIQQLDDLKKLADDLVARRDFQLGSADFLHCREYLSHVPSMFLCPIYQIIMENPHIAADGHSYELEAIEEWLKAGHYTSPVTNIKLKHKHLVPNKTLRSLIQDWHSKQSYSAF